MNRTDTVTEEELHAYLDGELPPEREALVESYLRSRPDEMRRLNAYYADGRKMARIFHRAERGAGRPSGPRQGLLRVAAAIILLSLGSAAGWVARDHPLFSADPFVDQAMAAHAMFASSGGAPSSLPLGDEARLETTLSRELAAPMRILKLRDLGYELVAAHVFPSRGARAVQLVYGSAGRPISIYLESRPGVRETSFRNGRRGSVTAVSWEDDNLACVISGEVEPRTLKAIGRRLYEALNS